jgi:HEAT repeat protein
LERILDSAPPQYRSAAVTVLGDMGFPQGLEVLRRRLPREHNESIRSEIERQLARHRP